MPSLDQRQMADAASLAAEHLQIITNAALSANPATHTGYVYYASLDTQNSGREFSQASSPEDILKEQRTLDVVISRQTRAVIFNERAIDRSLHEHQQEQQIHYLTVNEMVTGMSDDGKPLKSLPTHSRLIRVMTPLILQQYDQTFVALTRRGNGATHEGQFGCSSKLLGRPLTEEFVKAVAKSELVVTVDGATFTADGAPVVEAQLQLPRVPHTVNFHGGHANGQVQCVAVDSPEERTLTLIFPMMARLPEGNLAIRNADHPADETRLVKLSDLRLPEIKLMTGLKQYLLG